MQHTVDISEHSSKENKRISYTSSSMKQHVSPATASHSHWHDCFSKMFTDMTVLTKGKQKTKTKQWGKRDIIPLLLFFFLHAIHMCKATQQHIVSCITKPLVPLIKPVTWTAVCCGQGSANDRGSTGPANPRKTGTAASALMRGGSATMATSAMKSSILGWQPVWCRCRMLSSSQKAQQTHNEGPQRCHEIF